LIAWLAFPFSFSHLYTAHKLYPVRIRVVNLVTNAPQWVTTAYVPIVKKLTETAADERAKLRRSAVLQRVLYMAFLSVMNASHSGVTISTNDGKSLTAYPRLLLYIADQPEERAVLAFKQGMCGHPCSHCNVELKACGTAKALTAENRSVLRTFRDQVEASGHRRYGRHGARRLALEAEHSITAFLPAIAGMAGLSTEPNLLFRTIGFDILHVRCLLALFDENFFWWSDVLRRLARCDESPFSHCIALAPGCLA